MDRAGDKVAQRLVAAASPEVRNGFASGEFNVVTIVEWADERALANAKSSMQAHYAQEGFDADAFMKQLGVRGDLGIYATEAG